MHTFIPEGYLSLLSVYDTQKAIGLLKRLFEESYKDNDMPFGCGSGRTRSGKAGRPCRGTG